MNVFVGVRGWKDVNWYLEEGYYVANVQQVTFPGYFTLEFNLAEKDARNELSMLVMDARADGIKLTCDEDNVPARIGIALEEGVTNPRILSAGKMEIELPGEKKETFPDDIFGYDISTLDINDPVSETIPATTLEGRRAQLRRCFLFFQKVAELCKDTHEVYGALGNKAWGSACLIPKGTQEQVNYYGKPVNSLRVACNWNWRASLDNCGDEKMIQCLTNDMPWCRRRKEYGKASSPVWGNMVGYFGRDHRYHCIYGEKYDRQTRTWSWVDADPEKVAWTLHQEDQKIRAERTAVFKPLKMAEPEDDTE